MLIPPALLTEFTPDQLKLFISVIVEAKDNALYQFLIGDADDLQTFEVQLHNALNIITTNEKIYQS